MLTNNAARNAKSAGKDYKLADAGGLYLFVTTKEHRSWRLKYRFDGKEKRLVIGAYPETSLKAAREARDAAKRMLKDGRDPSAGRRRGVPIPIEGRTFEDVATEWFDHQKDRWKPVHAKDVIGSLKRDLFPAISDMTMVDIDEPVLLAALREGEARGTIEAAHRLRQPAERVLRYAAASGICRQNPASAVIEAMKAKPTKRRWPAITDLAVARVLIAVVNSAGASPVARLASRLG